MHHIKTSDVTINNLLVIESNIIKEGNNIMTTTTQPIKDFIPESQFNEWKKGIIAKAKTLLPALINDFNRKEVRLDHANRTAMSIFSKLENLNEEVFNNSLDLTFTLISEYSFQETDFSFISKLDFLNKKKDALRIRYLEKNIDLNHHIWVRFLSELHPIMAQLARHAYQLGATPIYITEQSFSEQRYYHESYKFPFFDKEFNRQDSDKYCLEVMPQLLQASDFDEEKALAFLDSILQWRAFELLQQSLVTDLNSLIEQNEPKEVPQPVAEFNINAPHLTKFELGLSDFKVMKFFRTLFDFISLTEVTPTGKPFIGDVISFYNDNPNKDILLHNHFNISVAEMKQSFLHSERKLTVKYVQ